MDNEPKNILMGWMVRILRSGEGGALFFSIVMDFIVLRFPAPERFIFPSIRKVLKCLFESLHQYIDKTVTEGSVDYLSGV